MEKTPWEILNIPQDSTVEEIERAYRKKSNGYEHEEFYFYFDEIYGAYAEAREAIGVPLEDIRAEEFMAGLYLRWEDPFCRDFIPFWRTVFTSKIFIELCTDEEVAGWLCEFFEKKVLREDVVHIIIDALNAVEHNVPDFKCGSVKELMERKLDIIKRTRSSSLKKKAPSYLRQNYEAPVTLGKRIGEYAIIAAAVFCIALLYKLTR